MAKAKTPNQSQPEKDIPALVRQALIEAGWFPSGEIAHQAPLPLDFRTPKWEDLLSRLNPLLGVRLRYAPLKDGCMKAAWARRETPTIAILVECVISLASSSRLQPPVTDSGAKTKPSIVRVTRPCSPSGAVASSKKTPKGSKGASGTEKPCHRRTKSAHYDNVREIVLTAIRVSTRIDPMRIKLNGLEQWRWSALKRELDKAFSSEGRVDFSAGSLKKGGKETAESQERSFATLDDLIRYVVTITAPGGDSD